ncbi:MAG: hypothetical protein LBJ93_01630 [Clostridiales bacterium]|jgi:transcriptional pleiotropic repressor|nr:hypothetical protein [Clostridiales bacterium]
MNKNIYEVIKELNDNAHSSLNNKDHIKSILGVAKKFSGAHVMWVDHKLESIVDHSGDVVLNNQKETINKFKSINSSQYGLKIDNYCAAVIPTGNGNSLWLLKSEGDFTEEEKLSAELCANNAAIADKNFKLSINHDEKRKNQTIKYVLNSLSFTEIDVVRQVLNSLSNNEGFIVASKIADENGYARSVTVNALRKLESAGVVETRSLGVKGTYIKILNDRLRFEIENYNKNS